MNRVSIGSDNGVSPIRYQAIIQTNAGFLSTGPVGTNLSEIVIKIHNFSFTKIHRKTSSAKWRPFWSRGRWDKAPACVITPTVSVCMGCHNFSSLITVTSKWVRWRLKSQASRLFTQPFVQVKIKENIKAPRHWPLFGEFTGEFPHKGPVTRKCFHLMTSSPDYANYFFTLYMWCVWHHRKCWEVISCETVPSHEYECQIIWYCIDNTICIHLIFCRVTLLAPEQSYDWPSTSGVTLKWTEINRYLTNTINVRLSMCN